MKAINYALVVCAFLVVIFLASQLAVDIKLHREWGMTVVAWIGWFLVLAGCAGVTKLEEEEARDEDEQD